MSIEPIHIFSALLFVASIFFYTKDGTSILFRSLFSFFAFISTVLYVFYFSADYFTADGINSAVIYHVSQGLEGAGFSEYKGLIVVAGASLIFGLFLSCWLFIKGKKGRSQKAGQEIYYYSAVVTICVSILLNPATSDLYGLTYRSQPARTMTAQEIDFNKYYSQPGIRAYGKKKNLVMVYAEGLERTYFDESIFPGLIKGLRGLEALGTTFTNVIQVEYTGWTMGGLVASQCGIPLVTTYRENNSMVGMDRYLASATCLTDLLFEKNYYNVFYGGANRVFAGKGLFLDTHNYQETHGEEDLRAKLFDKSYLSGWGLYDDSMLDLSYKRFLELSEKDGNFALVNLTLDTHPPKGHPSWRCKDIKYGDGSNQMLNSVACSDHLITNYVKKVLASSYASDTVVVIASDHLAFNNTAIDLLKKGNRRNMFIVIDPDSEPAVIDRLSSTLDYGSTILPYIGFDGNIGLGRDVSDIHQDTSEISYIHDNLSQWKPQVLRLWDFPSLKKGITINSKRRTMDINGRSFRVPALLELNSELDTRILFRAYSNEFSTYLVDLVLKMDKDTHFLLIESCDETKELTESYTGKGLLCIVAGRGGQYQNVNLIVNPLADTKTIALSPDDIRFFAGIKSDTAFNIERVAHAGGALDDRPATNSMDALDMSIKKGFRYFELDFKFTSDGHLVCIHDWDSAFENTFGFRLIGIPTLKEFKNLINRNPMFNNCTLDSLVPWLADNPTAVLITDVKENDNVLALEILARRVPNFSKRIIPQIYTPVNYDKVKNIGYKQIIWTLYRYEKDMESILGSIDSFKGPFAITMPKRWARTELPLLLARKHIPTYVHTVNNPKEANVFLNSYGVTELYTDYITPNSNP